MPDPYEKIEFPEYIPGTLYKPVIRGESGAYTEINRGVYALSLYSSGFFEAATELGERLSLNRGCVDTEIYPLVYLYHHGIELAVKYIHCFVAEILEKDESFKTTHKITDNLKSICDDIECILDTDEFAPKPDLEKINLIISDLVKDDPTAIAFRYPKLRNGDELAANLGSINIKSLCETLEYVKRELQQLIEWLEFIHPSPLTEKS
jgi:hypothetical protein